MGQLGSEKYANSPLAHMITVLHMPQSEVTDRTEATYRIGAEKLLVHLMSGDLRSNETNPAYDEFLPEFLRRVVENALQQGFELPNIDHQS